MTQIVFLTLELIPVNTSSLLTADCCTFSFKKTVNLWNPRILGWAAKSEKRTHRGEGTASSALLRTCSSLLRSRWSWGSWRTPGRPPWPWGETGRWPPSLRTCPVWLQCSPTPSGNRREYTHVWQLVRAKIRKKKQYKGSFLRWEDTILLNTNFLLEKKKKKKDAEPSASCLSNLENEIFAEHRSW